MPKNIVSQNHWQHYFDDLQYSSKDFYAKLKALIEEYKFPNVTISVSKFSEGGMLSSKREYLTIRRGEYRFDVCAAPFGKSFFVSWWLTELEGGCLLLLKRILLPDGVLGNNMKKTFYQVDTETIFKASIHSLIVKIIDGILPENGYRLPENARTLPQ